MSINNQIEGAFENLFLQLKSADLIKFPNPNQIIEWEAVLEKWIQLFDVPLFIRKPSDKRGSTYIHQCGRTFIYTDNTPAHWVYRNAAMGESVPTIEIVIDTLKRELFPFAIMRKISEKPHLKDTQIASRDYRLGKSNWKIAHIKRIALPRTMEKSIEDHIQHHRNFLSLSNMYLIHKNYSGLAEVPYFNELVKANK